MTITAAQFSQRILKWFDQHGRKNLPWQKPTSSYRVWISEIMLQQTQVNTVIPYFKRFIKCFPNIKNLAAANIDEVLALWAGLGYYARARNLHRTAQIIQRDFHGKFPSDLVTLQTLPGIGRSTAGAILALSMQQHATILDGNVKRVLARFHALPDWPGKPEITAQLWTLAESYTPQQRVAEYTQAIMDLGALICTRSQPKCGQCPLQTHCIAYAQDTPTAYPIAKPRKNVPVKTINLIMLRNPQGEILLEKRPPIGIWGGLWSLPEQVESINIQQWCEQHYYCRIDKLEPWPVFRHTFSHFHLDITPILAEVSHWQPPMMESPSLDWYDVAEATTKGLAAPIKKLLRALL